MPTFSMTTALSLDFDGSLRSFGSAIHADLSAWQEALRFGCGWSSWKAFEQHLNTEMPERYGTVFMGSGDFHHISYLLIKRMSCDQRFDVLVFDNHPDNMIFPFGIHCGSWIKHLAALPQVRTIHVAGICSHDIGAAHAWENHLLPLFSRKVRYWSIGVNTGWARWLGLSDVIRSFDDKDAMCSALGSALSKDAVPVYVSIDKDVLSQEVARTNWDQGCLTVDDIGRLIQAVNGRIIGSDVTGEISIHQYATRWKRVLSAMDEQPAISEDNLQQWQAQQLAINSQILGYLART